MRGAIRIAVSMISGTHCLLQEPASSLGRRVRDERHVIEGDTGVKGAETKFIRTGTKKTDLLRSRGPSRYTGQPVTQNAVILDHDVSGDISRHWR